MANPEPCRGRVDWSDNPLHDLHALWRLWRPQQDAYVARARNPKAAPGYFEQR